eukprot:11613870-Ditylum_brightwellii.AAC.1
MTTESLNHPESVPEMVQHLCVGTLDKYVSKPSVSHITENLLQALKRFKNSIHWKEFWHLKWIKESRAKCKKLSIKESKDDLEEVKDNDSDTAIKEANFESLGTDLRPVEKLKHAPKNPKT